MVCFLLDRIGVGASQPTLGVLTRAVESIIVRAAAKAATRAKLVASLLAAPYGLVVSAKRSADAWR